MAGAGVLLGLTGIAWGDNLRNMALWQLFLRSPGIYSKVKFIVSGDLLTFLIRDPLLPKADIGKSVNSEI